MKPREEISKSDIGVEILPEEPNKKDAVNAESLELDQGHDVLKSSVKELRGQGDTIKALLDDPLLPRESGDFVAGES